MYDSMPSEPSKPAQPPPSVYLNEKDLEKFGLHDCVPGEKYTAKINFTVTGMDAPSSGETSKRIEIDNMSDVSSEGVPGGEAAVETLEEGLPIAGDVEPAPEAEEEEETAGVPYIRRKAKKPSKFPIDFKKLQKV